MRQSRCVKRKATPERWKALSCFLLVAPIAFFLANGERESASAMQAHASPLVTSTPKTFPLCHTGGGYNCVVDGDTIWLGGQNIRIADIDAPETHKPRCASEKGPLGTELRGDCRH